MVLNGNEPEFVILSYDQYQKTDGAVRDGRESSEGQEGQEGEDDDKTIEKLNREILALKEEIRQKESAELIENTIEDTEEKEPIADVIDFE